MKKYNLILQIIAVMVIMSMLLTSVMPALADTVPVIPLNTSLKTFKPTNIGNNSVYIVPANSTTSYLTYAGKDGTGYYTTVGTTLGSSSRSVTNGSLNANLAQPDSLTPANPFLPTDTYSRLVNITEPNVSLSYQAPTEFSLHMGHSFTFFFNHSLSYIALLQTDKNYFLDINVINPSSYVAFDLSNTLYPGSSIHKQNEWTQTVIIGYTGLQIIPINTYAGNTYDGLVTLTPLPFDTSSFAKTTVKDGQYYSSDIQQGQCYNIQNDPAYQQTAKLLNLQFLQFPVKANKTYEIDYYLNTLNQYDTTYNYCPSGSLSVVGTDNSTLFNYYSTNTLLPGHNLVVNSKTNGNVNLLIVATGLVSNTIGFYFRENNNITIPKTPVENQLIFNKAINLKTTQQNNYYTFNITAPSMMAINYTGGTLPTFTWYMFDPTINDYSQVSTSNFYAEQGNLVNKSNYDLVRNGNNYNWVYMPVGQYMLTVSSNSPISSYKYEFNKVQIMTFSSGVDLTINKDSIYAIQLPTNPLYYNYINLSTTAHDNITVDYQWGIIGKYSSGGQTPDTVPFASSTTLLSFGNQENNGNWTAFNLNTTTLAIYPKPTQTNFVPILMIRPFDAYKYINSTYNEDISNHTYSTTIRLTSSYNASYYPSDSSLSYIGAGYQWVVPNTVSSSTSISINDYRINPNSNNLARQYTYEIPLATTPGELYNLTLATSGNYTSNPSTLNATIQSVYIHSDNLLDTVAMGLVSKRSTNTTGIWSELFFPNSNTSYLFVTVRRAYVALLPLLNSSLTVLLTKLNIQKMTLQTNVLPLNYNSKISNLEVVDKTPLYTVSDYSYPGSGSNLLGPLVLLTGGVIVIGAIAGGAIYFYSKKSGDGKFPK